jgi:hypothetical protein
MNHFAVLTFARDRQAELLHEAEQNRLADSARAARTVPEAPHPPAATAAGGQRARPASVGRGESAACTAC